MNHSLCTAVCPGFIPVAGDKHQNYVVFPFLPQLVIQFVTVFTVIIVYVFVHTVRLALSSLHSVVPAKIYFFLSIMP